MTNFDTDVKGKQVLKIFRDRDLTCFKVCDNLYVTDLAQIKVDCEAASSFSQHAIQCDLSRLSSKPLAARSVAHSLLVFPPDLRN